MISTNSAKEYVKTVQNKNSGLFTRMKAAIMATWTILNNERKALKQDLGTQEDIELLGTWFFDDKASGALEKAKKIDSIVASLSAKVQPRTFKELGYNSKDDLLNAISSVQKLSKDVSENITYKKEFDQVESEIKKMSDLIKINDGTTANDKREMLTILKTDLLFTIHVVKVTYAFTNTRINSILHLNLK